MIVLRVTETRTTAYCFHMKNKKSLQMKEKYQQITVCVRAFCIDFE